MNDDKEIEIVEEQPDTLNILDQDDDTKEEIEEKEPETEEKEPEKEEVEEKEEEEPEKEEEPERLDLVAPVRKKEILAKYPTIFKDFPYLEVAYFRDRQFSEIFPTVDDAKEAQEKADTLDHYTSEVSSGNIEGILSTIKQGDQESFNRLVDSYLVTLQKVDQVAYSHLMGNLFKNTVASMVSRANESNNEHLLGAANILHQFIFGHSSYSPPQNLSKGKEKDQGLENEKRALVQQRFEMVRDDLVTKTGNALRATISTNIDPKGQMSDYVRKKSIDDALTLTESMMSQDASFRKILDRAWDAAFKSGFSRASIEAIRTTIISKARTILPETIRRTRSEALRGLVRRKEETDKKGPIPMGRTSSPTKSKDVPKGMSTLEFLNRE